MLLRRVTKHITDQNWFAVFIDFLIVVVGVFIGIQVANWNAELTNREKEKIYYAQLVEDLQFEVTEYSGAIEITEWRMTAINDITLKVTGKAVAEKFSTPNLGDSFEPLPTREIGDVYPAAIGFIDTFDGSSSAYQSLLSTGDIDLIKNQSLLRKIQKYYSVVNSLQSMESRLIIFRDQTVSLRSKAGIGGADSMAIEEIAPIVGKHPDLLASLSSLWHFSEVQRRILKARKADALELIDEIKQELK